MRFLEWFSPRLGTAFALKLFFTPLRFRRPQREETILKSARQHALSTSKSDFTAFEWGPPTGTKVIMAHGWSGRGTQFFKIIEALMERGFHVFAFDAPAHGQSVKKKTHLLEFVDCIEVMTSRFGPFSAAIGHSLGGMAIFNALERNLTAQNLVTIGSPASIRNVVDDFCAQLQATPDIAERILAYIQKNYLMRPEEASIDHLAQRYNPKGLIIHDVNDLDIDIRNAEEIKERWPDANLFVTEGNGHRKVLMDIKVIDAIVGFMEE